MDLSELQASPTITIQLKHPATGELIADSEIIVHAPHTPQFRKEQLLSVKKNMLNQKELKDMTDEEMLERFDSTQKSSYETLAKIVIKHSLTMNGKKVKDLAVLFSDPMYYWIPEQLQKGIEQAQVFLKA